MTDIAIRVDNLSKLYQIGARQDRHDTLGDAVIGTFKRSNVLVAGNERCSCAELAGKGLADWLHPEEDEAWRDL